MEIKLYPLFSASRLFLERHGVEGLGRVACEARIHGGDVLVADFEAEFTTAGGIGSIENMVEHAYGVVTGSLRHDEQTDSHGGVLELFVRGNSVADGIAPAAQAAGNDIGPALIIELMRGNTVDFHIDAAARSIHKHLANQLRTGAGNGHLRSLLVRVKTILFFQHRDIPLQQASLHLRQAGKVEHAALVKLPLVVLIYKEEHKGSLARTGIPQLHIAQIGHGERAVVVAGKAADIAKIQQTGWLRLIAEEIPGEIPLLRHNQIAHLHLTGTRG